VLIIWTLVIRFAALQYGQSSSHKHLDCHVGYKTYMLADRPRRGCQTVLVW